MLRDARGHDLRALGTLRMLDLLSEISGADARVAG
jgi:hypothetical protein